MKYNAFDTIVEGYKVTEEEVLDMAPHLPVYDEIEQDIAHGRYIETVDGIEVYYDYGADYYFFCPVDEEL